MPATPFQTEAWTEYGLGSAILFLRYFARWKTVGFKGWQGDDYFAVAALVFWTAELVMLELIGQNGTNIGITDEMGAKLTDAEIAKLEYGSKCLLAGWNFYVTLIFCLKGAWIVAAKDCHLDPDECTLAVANYLTLVVLNIATDLVIVSIPVPLLWMVKLSIKRKLIIGVLLCSGVFIMIATLLRCILSLRDIQGINTSTIWAIRETFVGIIAVNAAAIKPLFSASRWLISSKGSSRDKGSSSYLNKYGHPLGTIGGSGIAAGLSGSRHQNRMTKLEDNSSEEHIVQKGGFGGYKPDVRAGSTTSGQSVGPDAIMVTRTYEVSPHKSTLDV
ncbi:hypothetical protein NM208_g11214 [Fusarium decemcellulare]|uniref:Uncharacterized protein n=1 Tax=Fusarium decemcellulare TaxID=57161 RepID=A0ACC1RV51_9HYPO|nr:hypothetical protein NM208_g11214 [Fusarium decemcellulare]